MINFLAIIGGISIVYWGIGISLGIWDVTQHLARFLAAGFRWKRMAEHTLFIAAVWPVYVYSLIPLKS